MRCILPGTDRATRQRAVGGKRKLIVPPALGYGVRGKGNTIPPNSMVVFEINLLEIKKGKPSQNPRGRDSAPS